MNPSAAESCLHIGTELRSAVLQFAEDTHTRILQKEARALGGGMDLAGFVTGCRLSLAASIRRMQMLLLIARATRYTNVRTWSWLCALRCSKLLLSFPLALSVLNLQCAPPLSRASFSAGPVLPAPLSLCPPSQTSRIATSLIALHGPSLSNILLSRIAQCSHHLRWF